VTFGSVLNEGLTVTVSVATTAGIGLGIWANVQLGRREKRRNFAEVHRDLTTGEVADARDVIGTVLYSPGAKGPRQLEVINAYFKLIWAVQRAMNALRVYNVSRETGRDIGSSREFWSWNYRELVENIGKIHWRYRDEYGISDDDAWMELVASVRQYDRVLAEAWLEPGLEARGES
jgi:hypothetical protein